MNLRMKRCMFGLMSWAALTGVVMAQSPNDSEGVVRMVKPRNPAVMQAAQSDAEQPTADESISPVPSTGSDLSTPEPLPPISQAPPAIMPPPPPMPPVGTNPGGLVGYKPVNRMFQPRFTMNSYGGGLYGYGAGYATMGGFVPFQIDNDDAILFVDARGLMTYDGQGGGNLGAGWRWWMNDYGYDRIVGLSGWFDNSNGGIGSNFSQMGASFESLGRYVDYRINGYIPAGQNAHYGPTTLGTNATAYGNTISFIQSTQVAQAYSGFDLETGGPLPILGKYGFKGYLGAYHFMGALTSASFTGVSGRFQTQINEDVSFGMQMTSDHTFGLNTQFQVFVTLPDGRPSRWMRNLSVQERLTQQVFRQYRAITHVDTIQTYQAAINPETDKPYFVAFINPNDANPGTGTDANPFNSIAQFNALTAAQRSAYDIVVVNGRIDGTSTNLDTGASNSTPADGLHLFNNQQLWAASSIQTFTTPNGTYTFKSDEETAAPILVNNEAYGGAGGGAVVTLANNNLVSGFTINGTNPLGIQNSGIVSQSGGITGNFTIENNTIENTLAAIQLVHSGDSLGLLTGNLINGGPAAALTLGTQSNLGMSVTQTAGVLDLLAQNNTVTNIKGGTATGTQTLGIGMQFIATGSTAVINANDPTSTTQVTGILNNTVTGSGAGLQIEALAGGTFNAAINTNALSSNVTGASITPTTGFGFAASAIGAGSVMTISSYTDNTTSKNEGDGAVFTANSGGILALTGPISGPVSGGTDTGDTFSNNDGDGMRVQSDGGQIVVDLISGVTFGSNGQNGLNFVTTNGGQITLTNALSDDAFTNNGGNGLLVNALGGTINLPVDNAANASVFNNNGTNSLTGGDGLLFQTSTAGVINTDVVGVTATGNGSDGIGFNLTGGAINVTNIESNVATGNKRDGLSIVNGASSVMSGSGGVFTTQSIGGSTVALGNNFSDNGRAGLYFGGAIAAPPSYNFINTIQNNNFNRDTSGTVGILFNTTSVFTTSITGGAVYIDDNSFVGGIGAANANTAEGVGGTINGGGVNLAFGDANASDTNTFTSNAYADIGLIFSGASVNMITIDNENLSKVINGSTTDPNFTGMGVGLIVQDSATLTGYIQRSTITNNATDGIFMSVTATNDTTFGQINNFTIGGSSTALGNTVTGNGQNGIEVDRTSAGEVNNMQILNNTVDSNFLNGLVLDSSNYNSVDTFTVSNNDFSKNGLNSFGDGILINVGADAVSNSYIDSNTINGNGGDGIETTEIVISPNDLRGVIGIWTRNTITGNALDGIELASSLGDSTTGQILTIGDPNTSGLGNFINGNDRNGINVEGTGTVLIGNNTISSNGGTGNTVSTANETAGIKADVAPTSNITLVSNTIINNNGDGIQYSIAQNFDGYFSQIQILNNTVSFNNGRGVNILNRGNNFIDVTMTGNVVNANQLEGVYVVNTASTDQQIWAASNIALLADGSVFNSPNINMQFASNQVLSNGFGTASYGGFGSPSEGLWVRVGTSGATTDPLDPGGFASTGAAVPVGGSTFDPVSDPIGTSTQRGGVTMTVDNNIFHGNYSDDIAFQSFVSTVNPTTGTVWDLAKTPSFNPAGYETDPLARLDLYFRNNTYDPGEANVNFAYNGVGTNNTSYVAYYNNADAVFKSRADNIAAASGPGPFNTTGTRRRNATREAGDYAPYDTPPGVESYFLYPGLGPSTFRISTDSDPIFTTDFSPYTSTADANGIYLPGNYQPGEMPYGWGTF